MAIKNTDNNYARLLIVDAPKLQLNKKEFILETSKDEASRNTPTEYTRPVFSRVNLSGNWNVTIDGSTTLDAIATEAYRCLKLENAYSDWSDV